MYGSRASWNIEASDCLPWSTAVNTAQQPKRFDQHARWYVYLTNSLLWGQWCDSFRSRSTACSVIEYVLKTSFFKVPFINNCSPVLITREFNYRLIKILLIPHFKYTLHMSSLVIDAEMSFTLIFKSYQHANLLISFSIFYWCIYIFFET